MGNEHTTPHIDDQLLIDVSQALIGQHIHKVRNVIGAAYTGFADLYAITQSESDRIAWLTAHRKLSEIRRKERRARLHRSTHCRYWAAR